MVKKYGPYTNHVFITMCEKEAEFVNKTFNLCSFYLQEENIIELIKEINETIKTINSISKITDINIKIYTTINVNIISNIINVENVIHVKNVIELLEKMDYNLYYQIAKKLGLLEKYEEDDVIKKIDSSINKFSNRRISYIKDNKTIF